MRQSRIHRLVIILGPILGLVAGCHDPLRPPDPGAITVTVTAGGTDVSHSGYRASLDNGPAYPVDSATSSLMFSDLEPGTHTVRLDGLRPNCAVIGQNPRSIIVESNRATVAAFDVECVANVGTVRVTTVTTGGDPDPNGYAVMVDGVRQADVGANAVVAIADVRVGGHVISLGGVASNCLVIGTHPINVNVAFHQTVDATLNVQCIGLGSIEVAVTTTGVDVDPDGYTVDLERLSQYYFAERLPVAPNGTVTFTKLPPAADYQVTLRGLSPNCHIVGAATRAVAVTEGGTARVAYAVSCEGAGTLDVSVATTGVDIDPDGYAVTVNAASVSFSDSRSIAPNGSVTFSQLRPAADYQVTLGDVPVNCRVVDAARRTVAVTAGSTTRVAYEVSCETAPRLAFVRDGHIFLIRSNGTGQTQLTSGSSYNAEPDWSSIGHIAFTTHRHEGDYELYAMNEDGTNPRRLTTSSGGDHAPSWSPDGTKIVFQSTRSGNSDLYVMNADGTGVSQLTSASAADISPAWSSTGKIAFISDRDQSNGEVYVMNSDGSNVVRLTNNEAREHTPAWSPDGSMIAFARDIECSYYTCAPDIFVMNADGSNERRLATGYSIYSSHVDPSWSPNGTAIAFTRNYCDSYYGCASPSIWMVDLQGTSLQLLVDNADNPTWKP